MAEAVGPDKTPVELYLDIWARRRNWGGEGLDLSLAVTTQEDDSVRTMMVKGDLSCRPSFIIG
jgi:hypothetical protein